MTTSDNEVRELQNPESWDLQSTVVHHPVPRPRAVVSVPFSREDFELISSYAQRVGMKTSAFIRAAALEWATPHEAEAVFGFIAGTAGSFVFPFELSPVTVVFSEPIESSGDPFDPAPVEPAA